MHVEFSTDNNIDGHEKLSAHVTEVVEDALVHCGERVTRVEVHLGDENGVKSGQHDKRCMMEARLENQKPLAVSHKAPTASQAIDGAAGKLARLIGNTLGRRNDQEQRRVDPGTIPPGDS